MIDYSWVVETKNEYDQQREWFATFSDASNYKQQLIGQGLPSENIDVGLIRVICDKFGEAEEYQDLVVFYVRDGKLEHGAPARFQREINRCLKTTTTGQGKA